MLTGVTIFLEGAIGLLFEPLTLQVNPLQQYMRLAVMIGELWKF